MTSPSKVLTRQIETLSHDGAAQLIDAAVAAATESGLPISVAVHDASATLLAFVRMDNAPELTVRVAQDKAYTSAAFGYPTHTLYDMLKDDEPLRLGLVHVPRLVAFGGGYPIASQGRAIGAIGISGGHYTQDMAVAQSALKNCGFEV